MRFISHLRLVILSCLILTPLAAFPKLSVKVNDIVLLNANKNEKYAQCLQQKLATFKGQTVDNGQLQWLRQTINNQCFYQLGYSNSGIIYPDQSFANNRLLVTVIEGQINSIIISGDQLLPKNWYYNYLQDSLEKPFNIDNLRESLLRLEQHPLVETMDARLMPSSELGQGTLMLDIKESSPYQLKMEVNNTSRSPSVGEYFVLLSAAHLSLTGHNDKLTLDLNFAEGLKELSSAYRFPINTRSWLTLHFLAAQAEVVEQPFDKLNISNEVGRGGLEYEYALIQSLNQQLNIHGSFILERSHSQLLGRSFSFSPGVKRGKTRLSILELGLQWSKRIIEQRQTSQAWRVNSQLQIGLPIFSATENKTGADGEFLKLQLQAQWRKRLSWDGQYQLTLELGGQWSNKPLLPLEIFSLGGHNTVRGYRQSLFARDIGWFSRINLPVRIKQGVEVSPFIDFGQVWNQHQQQKKTLASVGMAIGWQLSHSLQTNLYYAFPLLEKRKQGHSLQDEGFGFRVQYEFM